MRLLKYSKNRQQSLIKRLKADYTDACQVKLFLSLTDVSSGHSNCLFGYVVRDTGLRGNP